MLKKYKSYIVSILIALAVGGLSALATKGSTDIYTQIVKPPLAPPSNVFPIVWSILFIHMGISSAGVYEKIKSGNTKSTSALTVYAVNLAVNFLWSILFFNLEAYLFAFVWLLLLIAIIITMIIEFYKVEPWTAYLQIPYLLWCIFAAYLNLSIYILN